MFLFRKRKDSAENPEDTLKLEENARPEKPAKAVKPAGPARTPGKDSKEKAVKRAEPAAPAKDPFFQSEDSLQILESDTPVKVVIPASSLIEDEPDALLKIKEPESAGPPVPEEVVDGLFEKVNEGREEEDEDISLDAILPIVDRKAASKPAEKAAASTADKTRPAAPAPAAKADAPAEVPVLTLPAAEDKNKKATATTEAANAAANAAAASALASAASALASATSAAAPGTGGKTPPPAAEAEKKSGGDGKEKKKADEEDNKANLFSALFNKVEEAEETPLDRLIKTLPEVSMEEVMNEAEEVKGLMSEWFQNQSK